MPQEHWRCLRTNNPLERLMRKIRRRTRVAGAFPHGKPALMLVAARLRHVAGMRWGTKRSADSRTGALEVVINGQSVQRHEVLADGSLQSLCFQDQV